MLRLLLGASTLLFTGCVPVSVPLSDPSKAEPDKELIGKWKAIDSTGNQVARGKIITIDVPVVKGNPKGLMRYLDNKWSMWFFTTKMDKHSYATIFMGPNQPKKGTDNILTDFSEEGEFEKFMKREEQSYLIMSYMIENNKLIVDVGDHSNFVEKMKAENISSKNDFYKTPKDWLVNYLKKNQQKVFNSENTVTYQRFKD